MERFFFNMVKDYPSDRKYGLWLDFKIIQVSRFILAMTNEALFFEMCSFTEY